MRPGQRRWRSSLSTGSVRCAPESRSSGCAGRQSAALAWAAISGIDWIADEPVPITATRLPVRSTPSMRPAAGEVHLASKAIGASDVDFLGHRQATRCHHMKRQLI